MKFYVHGTDAMKAALDEVMDNAEKNLRNAYEKQLAVQKATWISLPATNEQGLVVYHGCRVLADHANDYWDQIARANYFFLRTMGRSDLAFAIKDEFIDKGLKTKGYF